MPKVGKKHFPYTKAGRAAAKKARQENIKSGKSKRLTKAAADKLRADLQSERAVFQGPVKSMLWDDEKYDKKFRELSRSARKARQAGDPDADDRQLEHQILTEAAIQPAADRRLGRKHSLNQRRLFDKATDYPRGSRMEQKYLLERERSHADAPTERGLPWGRHHTSKENVAYNKRIFSDRIGDSRGRTASRREIDQEDEGERLVGERRRDKAKDRNRWKLRDLEGRTITQFIKWEKDQKKKRSLQKAASRKIKEKK